MTTAGLASLLPVPVAILLAGAAVCPLVARMSRRAPLLVSLLCLGASSVLLLMMAPTVFGGRMLVHFMGHWVPVDGKVLGDAFAADPFGLIFALVCAVVGAILVLFTLSSLSDLGQRELGMFACLFLLLDAALIGSALTADLVNLFVWFEVAALASYGLTAFSLERPIALEAAFKILVLTNVASFLVFIGAALVYAQHGALNFAQAFHAVSQHPQTPDVIALALLIAGFATKAGLVPFHGWLPDAHTAAPGPVSALFSGLMVNLGIVAIARVTLQVFTPGAGRPELGLLMALGLVSAVGGALFALLQDDLKRVLAYDTISQMGVLAVGLATANASGLAGMTYHLINHALFKSLLFLCAGAIVHATGATQLSEMGGLARRMPAIAAAFTFGVVAIAGIPPLNGYASVGLIHDALLDTDQLVPLVVILVAQVLTIAALGRAAWLAFYRPADPDFGRDEQLHPGMVVAMGALAAGCVAFGVLPGLVLDHVVGPAVGGLLDPGAYASNILASGGHLRAAHISFDYSNPREMLTVVATVACAWPVARLAISPRTKPFLDRVRVVQTGSVNDYAGYLVMGLLVAAATIGLG